MRSPLTAAFFGPHTILNTVNGEMDPGQPIPGQGREARPVEVGPDCWIGMGIDLPALRRRVAAARERLTVEGNLSRVIALYGEVARG